MGQRLQMTQHTSWQCTSEGCDWHPLMAAATLLLVMTVKTPANTQTHHLISHLSARLVSNPAWQTLTELWKVLAGGLQTTASGRALTELTKKKAATEAVNTPQPHVPS